MCSVQTYTQPEEPLPPPPSEANVVNDVYAVPKKVSVSNKHLLAQLVKVSECVGS